MDEAGSCGPEPRCYNRGMVPVFLLSAARDPEQALANDPCQDADCEGLIGVNVYGSGARLVITVAL
jgi:hypothetical protein